MIRTAFTILMAGATVVVLVVGLTSCWQPLHWENEGPWGIGYRSAAVASFRLIVLCIDEVAVIAPKDFEVNLAGFRLAYFEGVFDEPRNWHRLDQATGELVKAPYPVKTDCWFLLSVPLWVPLVVTSPYPTIVLVRGPLRRYRRRRKGRCVKCGYHLTGNVSGVCPECGERT